MQFFFNKKQLKGSKVIITEELVKFRYDLYQLARQKIGAMHVWTMNGKIFTKHNERKVHIRNEEDVLKIKKRSMGLLGKRWEYIIFVCFLFYLPI
nr:unnamed protein product [Callosobruchus analis]